MPSEQKTTTLDEDKFQEMQHREAIIHAVLHANTEILERYNAQYMQLHADTHERLDEMERQGQTTQEIQAKLVDSVGKIIERLDRFEKLLAPNRLLDTLGQVPEFFLRNRIGQALVFLGVLASLVASGDWGAAKMWIKAFMGWGKP